MELTVVTSILQYLAVLVASASILPLTSFALIPLALSTALCVVMPAYVEKHGSYLKMSARFDFVCKLTYILFFTCLVMLSLKNNQCSTEALVSIFGFLEVTCLFFF